MPPVPKSLDRPFGRALQRLRREAGLTQEDLAFACAVHPTYISQLERGLKSPSLRTITRLARALNRRPHELVRAAEDLAP